MAAATTNVGASALKSSAVNAIDEESSVDSLLSDWNEDSSDEENDTTDVTDDTELEKDNSSTKNQSTAASKRLRRKFALRGSLLKRMCKGKDASYATMLMHHESLVQAEALQLLNETKRDSKDKTEGKQVLPLSSLRSRLIFEARLTIPGLVAVLLYCSTHLAAYEATQCMVLELTRIEVLSDHEFLFYTGCVVVALIITRLTGGVFDWVSKERHEMAKFDLHNRIRLNYTDAKLHLWFRQHKTLKFLLDTIALYICLVGVAYFHYRLLTPFFSNRDWIIDNLPSKAQGAAETPIHWWLKGRLTPECNDEDEQCSWHEEMTHQDERYVWGQVSVASYQQFMGNEAAPGLTPGAVQVLHLCIASVAIFLLQKLEFNWH